MFEKLSRQAERAWALAQRLVPEPPPVAKRGDALALGLIGAGGIGKLHITAIDRTAEVRLAAVSDANTALAGQVARRYGIPAYRDYKELLEDPGIEAVAVATPSHLHASMALAVLDAGKHLLVEKPIALSVSDADRIVARARESDLRLGVAHQFRTTSRYREMLRLVEEGVFGDLLRGVWIQNLVRSQVYYDGSRWRGEWAGGGGALLNQYIHDLDMLCGLFGEPAEVTGRVANLAHDSQVEDLASGVVVFRSGAHVVLQVGLFDADPSSYVEIVGDRASLRETGSRRRLSVPTSPIRRYVQEARQQTGGNHVVRRVRLRGRMEAGWAGHAAIHRDFAAAVRAGRDPMVPGEAARQALEIVNGLLVSSVTGERIALPLDREAHLPVLTELLEGRRESDSWYASEAGRRAEQRRKDAVKEQELAILGGPPAVSVAPREQWAIPRDRIKDAVGDLIDRNVFTEPGGGTTGELERRFAAYVGAKHCLAQNNGTSTLWAAYYALGVGPGDEVLHPAYTWICAIAPAVHLGARPVFCEVDPRTLCVDPADLERRITPRTRAISVVHIHGNVCDMDAILEIARRHRLPVLEDCSHCAGAEWGGQKVGTLGDVGCYSMQGDPIGGKALPSGEGGLVVTSRRDLYERMLFFGHLNRAGVAEELSDRELRSLAPTNSGIKFRAHPWAMAAALVLMESLDERNEKRRRYRDRLYEELSDVPGVEPLQDHPKALPAGFHGGLQLLYRPDELGGLPRQEFIDAVAAEGVAISPINPSYRTHRLPLFAEGHDIYGRGGPLTGDYPGYPAGSLPVTEDVYERLFSMPAFIEAPPRYAEQAVLAIRKVAARYSTLQTPKAKVRRAATRTTLAAARTAKRGLRRFLSR